jgi:hypothetical protein
MSDRSLNLSALGGLTLSSTPTSTAIDHHHLSQDGFIVPTSLREFTKRFPNYLAGYVRCRTPNASDAERNDIAIDLARYLMTPLVGSGCTDRIAGFNPRFKHETSAGHFFQYVNLCLVQYLRLLQKSSSSNLLHSGSVGAEL